MTNHPLLCTGVFAISMLVEPAWGADEEPTERRSSWRDAIVLEVIERYQREHVAAEPAVATAETSIFENPDSQPADPEVVVLEPVIVLADPDLKRLEEVLKKNYGRSSPGKPRWGTGVRMRDFGRVRVVVGSILYVPVVIGISW
jgi:hypothetical protein